MPFPERQGGWGVGQMPNPPTNPFAKPSPAPLQPANPFAQIQTNSSNAPNPFLQKQPNGAVPAPNPFLVNRANPFTNSKPAAQTKPFSPFAPQQNSTPREPKSFSKPGFGQASKPTATTNKISSTPNPFAKPPTFTSGSGAKPIPNTNGTRKVSEYVKPAWPTQSQKTPDLAPNNHMNGKRKNENDLQRRSKFSRKSPDDEVASIRSTRDTRKDTSLGIDKPTNSRREEPEVFAKKILDQLQKDNIKPPRWPENPGNFESRQAVERLRESHKAYRERARKSLMRAGLIDDPDKKRRLDEALVFKGICEDMCPEWEQITRIVEHDIKGPEKGTNNQGDLVPMPELMVKRLARSAAGQDAPLPMDVRSVRTLRRTLSYLTDLIESDDLLPQRHSFLWDRTRAIRIDFSFQKYAMTPAEIEDQIYCLETIARFHVTSLHLLSRNGSTPVDFSEQQEVEQLSKTLISLMEVYDDCAQQGIKCKNESEFRGYFIVFNAFNPSLTERIEDWDRRFGNAQGIKSAIFITECIKNVQRLQGPLHPESNTQMTIDFASAFFEFIKNPDVSYTMACFAEIHFNTIRKAVVKLVKKSYSRPRFGPKDLTPAALKQHLYTDTEEEAVDFFTKHGFQFDDDGNYLVLCPNPEYVDTRVPHPFSGDIVERKRCGQPFAVVVHSTVSESDFATDSQMAGQVNEEEDENENLFVTDSQSGSSDSNDQEEEDSEAQDSESGESTASSRPLPAMLGNHVVTKQSIGAPVEQSRSPTPGETVSLSPPLFTGQPSIPTSAPLGQSGTSIFAQPSKDGLLSSAVSSPGSALGTTSLGNLTSASNSWAQKSQTDAINGGAMSQQRTGTPNAPSLPKTVRFADGIPPGQTPPTDNTNAAPSVFGFLANNDGDKGVATSTALPSASLFPGLLPNKEVPKLQSASLTSTTLAPVGNTVQPPITSPLPTFPAFTTTQPTTSQSSTLERQLAPSPITSLNDVSNIAPSSSSFKEASATPAPDILSKTTSEKTAQRDLMGDFTNWFVCGDRGLMESQLEELAVEYILKDTWIAFQTFEEERIRKEEEESLLAEALEFRVKSLQVKFFYRWKDGFRKRQRIKRMKMEMEKGRQWRLPENVAKRERIEKEKQERAVQEAKDSMLKRSRHNVKETAKLRHSAGPTMGSGVQGLEDDLNGSQLETSSLQSRVEYIEDQLLATGVFEGVRDERAAARYAAMACDPEAEKEKRLETKIRLRAENHDRLNRGLRPLKALPEPKVHKEGSKTAMLRAQCRLAERGNSLYKSTGSFRSSPFSSSYRSSLGYNNSRVSKSRSRVTDPYWRLKANGLVRMPNGEYLHESIALPILQGDSRVSRLGSYGVRPVEPETPAHSPPPLPDGFFSSPIQADGLIQSKDTPSSGGSQKRKRTADEEELASIDFGTPTGTKRVRSEERDSPSVTDAKNHLADIESLMKRVTSLKRSTSKRA
ncbi:SAC3/GANP/Nin1/mts3/eIF-3 p25 family-domain-containing protein [Annulohypoxylon maeteangense]|uniref:SAC3/GANP/Nin1/mts3/eIF-3 p25 family-domain-containing protein n=1 Tax=Annulohypoxylon maeteangense TaxID=1927788 RepID=UPI0020075591|nr:SAC3/GANP/Nin1/mts3/eIF-3 p25 family-domain-containing protein [Annulohypoxylon maeteangense]KAI0881070.1 SAC3/GANP/Nin1/mts3/eIF-3 p25 family-domain-containing protein [Annulohypoxylon maeteangense]